MIDQHEILAAWAESNIEQRAALIDLVIGACMLATGYSFLSIDTDKLKQVGKDFDVIRSVDGNTWHIQLLPKTG